MESSDFLPIRELGEFPISYGSSMAILLLTDSNNESPSADEAAKGKPEEIWINIATLFRNIHNAIDKGYYKLLNELTGTTIMYDEISQIVDYLKGHLNDTIKINFYYSDYKYLKKEFSKANLKSPSTAKQKEYAKLEEDICSIVANDLETYIEENLMQGDEALAEFHNFKKFPECEFKEIWVMTHLPVDLLGFKKAKKIRLLESHTAKLKSKANWNSKFSGADKLKHIPFNKLTIQIFGDKSNHFLTAPNKVKKAVLEVAEENNWKATTPERLTRFHISNMKDRFTSSVLLSMY